MFRGILYGVLSAFAVSLVTYWALKDSDAEKQRQKDEEEAKKKAEAEAAAAEAAPAPTPSEQLHSDLGVTTDDPEALASVKPIIQ